VLATKSPQRSMVPDESTRFPITFDHRRECACHVNFIPYRVQDFGHVLQGFGSAEAPTAIGPVV
jgi:hypothetical protein